MTSLILDTQHDIDWVGDVHKVPVDNVKIVILFGNEDCPTRIETYEKNNIQCEPKIYALTKEGSYERTDKR